MSCIKYIFLTHSRTTAVRATSRMLDAHAAG